MPLLLGVALAGPATLPAPACGGLDELGLATQPVPLLDDRVRLRAPFGTVEAPRGGNVMAAPTSSARESRLFLEHDGEVLVVMAYETFSRTDDPVGTLAGWLPDGAEGWTVDRLAGTAVPVAVAWPPKLSAQGDAVRVLRALVARPDGMVQLDFFVNPAVMGDGLGCVALAHQVAASVAPGPRALTLDGGPATLVGPSASVAVTLPAGWTTTVDHGPDFSVWRLHRVDAPGAQAWLGVYLGRHPSAIGAGEPVVGQLLGRPVVWNKRAVADGWMLEAQVPTGEHGVMHVFGLAPDEATVKRFMDVAGAMTLVP